MGWSAVGGAEKFRSVVAQQVAVEVGRTPWSEWRGVVLTNCGPLVSMIASHVARFLLPGDGVNYSIK